MCVCVCYQSTVPSNCREDSSQQNFYFLIAKQKFESRSRKGETGRVRTSLPGVDKYFILSFRIYREFKKSALLDS